jgi:phage/plasmid-like protein (TIGR03299 family)
MSHNINENRMFYTGERPWHGLGVELKEPATARQAIEAARLDYRVELEDLYLKSAKRIDIAKATVRADNCRALGIVSDRYQIVQNVDAFTFFDTVVGEGQAIYHTAGALGKGERIWILAKLPKNIMVTREDIVEKYLVLMNSHDGTSALKLYFTPIRVVCQNTLIVSLKERGDGISIRHTGDIKSKVNEARRILGLTIDYYAQFEQITKQLLDVQMTVAKTEKYFENLLFREKDISDISTNMLNKKNRLLDLFENGKGMKLSGVRHTAWAALNAVVEFVDHDKTVKGIGSDPTRKLKDIWFGTGAQLKQKAYDSIVDLCGIKISTN